ncbi:Phytochrome-like protein cph1 [Neolewinella maritima]|uniref:histidine kinase n=1 Tax=Neolewinella maritima TaxID=1383882 RepID=A0ABM9AVY4_9BACT|nr:ATP-binding protein [Neolewinella maritima]CAH0998837.1 Phytochrome-like protein cph1 [Neolewinella maritima]
MEVLPNSPIKVQAYAVVLVIDRPTLVITAASANTQTIGWRQADTLIGNGLRHYLSVETLGKITAFTQHAEPGVVPLTAQDGFPDRSHQIVLYQFAEELVIEIEPHQNWPHPDDYATRLNDFTRRLEDAANVDALLQCLCDGIGYHFGYDRVLALQFDEQNNGLVTNEFVESGTESFLHVHFTSEDITASTRYNQLVESVHNFADFDTAMVEIRGSYGPAAREMLRRHAGSREPNENFRQFLRDTGMRCIGYVSLAVGGVLNGSIYMHSDEPVYIDYQMRTFLSVVGRIAQQKLGYHIYSRTLRLRQAANVVRDRLYEHIVNSEHPAEGLTGGTTTLIDLIEDTHGAAICADEQLTLFGITPSEAQTDAIIDWMKGFNGEERLYHTDRLGELYPAAKAYPQLAAGILFLPLDISANQWIVWFKPEVVQTIAYGSSTAPQTAGGKQDYSTSRRFYVHNDTRHGYSLPWTADDIGTAVALQAFIKEVVMQRYARAKHNNALLQQAYDDLEVFSYTVGHDLRAPLRGISSFAEILRTDFADTLGEEGLSHLRLIQDNAKRMRNFMNDLLALSRIDRASIIINAHSLKTLVENALLDQVTTAEPPFELIVHEDMPPLHGDRSHLQTVVNNLLSNAIKYSAARETPRIEVGCTGTGRGGYPVFFVEDNGIGIPPAHRDRIFDLFTRGGNVGDLPGTGIGLALVKRVLSFHEGDIWIEPSTPTGTRFLFYTGVQAVSYADN